jgi:hypothetical protein
MLSRLLEYLCTVLECFLQGWNAFDSAGMLSTELEYLCTELEYVSTPLECCVQGRHVSYRVGMLSTGLECLRQRWNTFVLGSNAF